jgi:hypothetical protein
MLAGGKEEGPEPPACAVGVAEVALLPRGEDLGQVPGVFLRMVLAPHGHEDGVRVVPSLASISTWMFLTFEGVGLDQSFVTLAVICGASDVSAAAVASAFGGGGPAATGYKRPG